MYRFLNITPKKSYTPYAFISHGILILGNGCNYFFLDIKNYFFYDAKYFIVRRSIVCNDNSTNKSIPIRVNPELSGGAK